MNDNSVIVKPLSTKNIVDVVQLPIRELNTVLINCKIGTRAPLPIMTSQQVKRDPFIYCLIRVSSPTM
jgi:hypothetical protein